MNIIHINLQKTWRGGEQQLAYLLDSLKKNSINQILICRKNSALHEFAQKKNIKCTPLKKGLFSTIANILTLFNLIRSNNIEIIHCHESKGHSLAVFSKIIFNYKAKIILHRRVIFPIKGYLSKKIKYSPKYISEVICISKAVEKSIHKSTNCNNTVVIPDMIDTQYLYPKLNILRTEFKIKENKIIGYIAALTPEKDHYTFLNTAKFLLNHDSNFHFVLIGDGKNEKELKLYAKKIGLDNKVTFTGFIKDAKKIISEIDILLFTSVEEGLGTTILDFFLAKKPVVCVKNGGSEDIVINDITGFICEKRDSEGLAKKILYLLQNQKIANNIMNIRNLS